jgi:hypothetical protein
MSRIRIVVITAIAVVLSLGGAHAQTATSEPVGKPLALLAGLRPPHESKATVHGRAAHRATKKTAAKKTHPALTRKIAAEHTGAAHTRHVAAKNHKHRERSVAVAAPAAAPPAQTAPIPKPANDGPVADAMLPVDAASTPVPQTAATDDSSPNALAVNGETVKVNSPDQVNSLDLAASQAATPSAHADAQPASETVLAAPVLRDTSAVGSASWIAQVLAALGGAIAAGAVAWFLIGGGPVRTYG